ncbi:MAG: hypothetical protein O8C66_15610 [Candidatus Methanoperedens sp.]|nr:hypothetical protein [Candidatus Methanoperedens sp.]MCZ7371924.1 hypothetical protein [Candidatus Methanoperedens sp.]
MEAVKQIIKIPKNHEIKIKVPREFPENETVEVILIMKKKQDSFRERIRELKNAAKDKLFLEDMEEISEDFKSIDLEGLDDAV